MKRLILQPVLNLKLGYKFISKLADSELLKEDIRMNFLGCLPGIIENITLKKYKNICDVKEKIQKAAVYNLKTENKIGGMILLHAFSTLEKDKNVSADTLRKAFVLAWGIEMVQSHSLMMDKTDFEPSSVDNEINANFESSAKHAELLRSFVHIMLEYHFEGSRQYTDLLQLYNKAFIYNALAREIEHATSRSINNFNEELYDQLCSKTAYQTLTLPFLLAYKLANRTDDVLYTGVERLSLEMGKLYQMKKDFNNCFSGEDTIGTSGTDIQSHRCTWLAVKALQRFTKPQRVVFSACYGGNQPAHIERVKVLYKDVRLPDIFRQQQAAMCHGIKRKADDLEKKGIPSDVFLKILDEIMRDDSLLGK